MSPTPDGNNVLFTYENKIYTLSISGSSYVWLEKPQQLSISRTRHLQFTLPASLISACTLIGRVFYNIFLILCLGLTCTKSMILSNVFKLNIKLQFFLIVLFRIYLFVDLINLAEFKLSILQGKDKCARKNKVVCRFKLTN